MTTDLAGWVRRVWWILACGIATLILVVVFFAFIATRKHEPPWGQMEKAVRSFPLPTGYVMSVPTHTGGSCSPLNPSCKSPIVVVSVEPPNGSSVTCDRLRSMVDTWTQDGFVLEKATATQSGECVFDGQVFGISTDASLGQGIVTVSAGVPG